MEMCPVVVKFCLILPCIVCLSVCLSVCLPVCMYDYVGVCACIHPCGCLGVDGCLCVGCVRLQDGRTPAMLASEEGHEGFLRQLLGGGAGVEPKDKVPACKCA